MLRLAGMVPLIGDAKAWGNSDEYEPQDWFSKLGLVCFSFKSLVSQPHWEGVRQGFPNSHLQKMDARHTSMCLLLRPVLDEPKVMLPSPGFMMSTCASICALFVDFSENLLVLVYTSSTLSRSGFRSDESLEPRRKSAMKDVEKYGTIAPTRSLPFRLLLARLKLSTW